MEPRSGEADGMITIYAKMFTDLYGPNSATATNGNEKKILRYDFQCIAWHNGVSSCDVHVYTRIARVCIAIVNSEMFVQGCNVLNNILSHSHCLSSLATLTLRIMLFSFGTSLWKSYIFVVYRIFTYIYSDKVSDICWYIC